MEKFEGVNLVFTMREILKAYSFGKTQFDTALELRMQDTAFVQDEHLRLLWVLVTLGEVRCYRLWDVMREGTVEHREWCKLQARDDIMVAAYAVTPYTTPGSMLFGDICVLCCEGRPFSLVEEAVPITAEVVHYADGHNVRLTPDEALEFESTDDVAGFTKEYPEDAVREAVGKQIARQNGAKNGNWVSHVRQLRNLRTFFEAKRICREIEAMPEPNGPGKTHYILPAPAWYFQMNQRDRDNFHDFIYFNSFSIGHTPKDGPIITVHAKDVQLERDELAAAAPPKPKKKTKTDRER